jgi:hypothetical protein
MNNSQSLGVDRLAQLEKSIRQLKAFIYDLVDEGGEERRGPYSAEAKWHNVKVRADKLVAEVAALRAAGDPPPHAETGKPQTMADAAEMLWVVLANVSGGDWTKQSEEWREAAARWRDNYFAVVKAGRAAGDAGGWQHCRSCRGLGRVNALNGRLSALLRALAALEAEMIEAYRAHHYVIDDRTTLHWTAKIRALRASAETEP